VTPAQLIAACLLVPAAGAAGIALAGRAPNVREGVTLGTAGLLFAAHPIHVEPVANIVGRAELMCAAGVVGALVLMLKPLTTAGRVTRDLPPPRTIRDFVLDQLSGVPLETLRRQGLRRDF